MDASPAQREAVAGRPCIVCGAKPVDPAHIISRAMGGCDHSLCVIPLDRDCHRAYDQHRLNLLPHLEPDWRAQLAHAVAHVGLIGALARIAGPAHTPSNGTAHPHASPGPSARSNDGEDPRARPQPPGCSVRAACDSPHHLCEHVFERSNVEHEARCALLALCAVNGASWNVIAREVRRPGGLARLLAGVVTDTSSDAERTARALADAAPTIGANLDRAERAIEHARRVGARLITVLDDDYPANLRLIHNVVPFLFVRGQLRQEDARSVAVVGTRDASEDGLRRTAKLAALLAEHDVTVLSGLARGIDTRAHEAALAAGGRTIAVIGTGILRTYPRENTKLAERIAEHGAVVSQFWPDQPPTRYTFPRRNVVTSGMGQGTVVVEAASTSGAKLQARLALEHGKHVFLLRTLIRDQPWVRAYLERGAIEVADVTTIIERLRPPNGIEAPADARQQVAPDRS